MANNCPCLGNYSHLGRTWREQLDRLRKFRYPNQCSEGARCLGFRANCTCSTSTVTTIRFYWLVYLYLPRNSVQTLKLMEITEYFYDPDTEPAHQLLASGAPLISRQGLSIYQVVNFGNMQSHVTPIRSEFYQNIWYSKLICLSYFMSLIVAAMTLYLVPGGGGTQYLTRGISDLLIQYVYWGTFNFLFLFICSLLFADETLQRLWGKSSLGKFLSKNYWSKCAWGFCICSLLCLVGIFDFGVRAYDGYDILM